MIIWVEVRVVWGCLLCLVSKAGVGGEEQTCGTEPLTCGVCANSGYLVLEWNGIVGYLAVSELENWCWGQETSNRA